MEGLSFLLKQIIKTFLFVFQSQQQSSVPVVSKSFIAKATPCSTQTLRLALLLFHGIESNQLGHWVSCSTGKAHVLNSARLPPNMTPASTMLSASNVPSLTRNPQTTTLVLKPISSQHAATLQAKFCLKTIPSSSRLKGDDTWSY